MANIKINKQAIRKMSREMEREFAKNPVRVPLEAAPPAGAIPAATTVNNYNGPVVTVNGDHAQLAWDSQSVTQTQVNSEQVAAGYERLAQVLADILANLPSFQLNENDEAEIRENANIVLQEVVKPEPNRSIVRRCITLIKGLLAPISAGLEKAVTGETAEATRDVIGALGTSLPF